MGKKLDRAFDIMRERNKRYLEEQERKNKSESETQGVGDQAKQGVGDQTEQGVGDQTEREVIDSPEQGSSVSPEQVTEEPGARKTEASADETEELDPETREELRRAEEKRRAYQEQNDGAAGAYRIDDRGGDGDPEKKAKEFHDREREQPKLEKGDVPAMIISAILVFGPVFLILFLLLLLAWLFLH